MFAGVPPWIAASRIGGGAPAGLTARYWRLRGFTAGSVGDGGLAEVEFYSVVGGADITTGGTAISGSTGSGSAAQAFDGDKTTSHWGGAAGSVYAGTSWVGYDFGAGNAVSVAQFEITARATPNPDQVWDGFALDYSADGTNWTTIDTFVDTGAWSSNESRKYTAVTTPPARVSARYWRLNGTVAGTYNGGALSEIEFYAPSPAGIDAATGGTPISGSELAGTTDDKAFDGIRDSASYWAGVSGAVAAGTSWIGYDFGSPVPLIQFELTARSGVNSNQMWDGWNLDYSSDGVGWTTLQGYSDTASWAGLERRMYQVANP